jgi:hypothetical protein
VKLSLNILFNAKKGGSPARALEKSLAEKGLRIERGYNAEDIVRAVKDAHPQLAPHFKNDEEVRLQRLDSDIAEEIALHFADKAKPCLIVHDSFIVKASDVVELRLTMTRAYRKRFGFLPLIH